MADLPPKSRTTRRRSTAMHEFGFGFGVACCEVWVAAVPVDDSTTEVPYERLGGEPNHQAKGQTSS